METKTYDGWTNYETWNVALWLDNDQGSQSYWQEQAQECWDEAEPRNENWTREQEAAITLADRLKETHEEAEADILDEAKLSASLWADLLGAALSEVNWYEIAEHYIEDVDKTEASEAES